MLTLRKMELNDLPMFQNWLGMPHVAKWYHNPDDWVMEVEKQDGEYRWIHHFIAEVAGRPVGFCQYYACCDSDETWFAGLKTGGAYSIDYLIGDIGALRRGFGRQIIARLTEEILCHADAARIVVQPERENEASCRLLRSCGFALVNEKDAIYVKELRGAKR